MLTKETIIGLLTNAKETAGKEIIANCPFCNKPQHFFINKYTFLYTCKKCGTDGNKYSLLRHLGKLHLLEGESICTQLKPLQVELERQSLDLDLKQQRLPVGFTPLNYNDKNSFAAYLRKRKFTNTDFKLYQPGYTELLSRFQAYVLLPIYRDMSIKGMVGRYIKNDPDKKRYENSKGTKFTKLVYGLDEFTNATNTVLIVEGPFDKISVTTELNLHTQEEVKCVCTFGKKISDYQLELIKRYKNVNTLVFCYDVYDAINEMKRGGLAALNYFKNVFACHHLTQKDPGDMHYAEIMQMLNSAEKIQNFVYNRVSGIK